METGKICHVKNELQLHLMEGILISSCKNQFLIMIDGKLPQEHEKRAVLLIDG